MYAAIGEPNVKWGAPISNGGPGTTGPPLATALVLQNLYRHLMMQGLQLIYLLFFSKLCKNIIYFSGARSVFIRRKCVQQPQVALFC